MRHQPNKFISLTQTKRNIGTVLFDFKNCFAISEDEATTTGKTRNEPALFLHTFRTACGRSDEGDG